MFITFEGGEGCGKSTHAKLLKEYLEGQGRNVLLTHEPGGTQLGAILRENLLNKDLSLEPYSEILLFAADRVEHVEKLILPALSAGKIVICDRYLDSTLAYQLGGRGLPEDFVRYLNWISCRGLAPDLTFLLNVSIEEGLKRAVAKTGHGGDRFEKEIKAFHERVQNKYHEIAQNEPQRIYSLDTVEEIETIQKRVRLQVDKKLK